ncbi:PRD domain-containing protein [Sporolactobacillus sp. THM7-4]|nr:PRD domain-containing protein [Sporolactobacillus sp. THM7-4]
MLMTNREKTIIKLLVKTSGRHTSLSIASYLQVSVRTVLRDLKKIEKTLSQFGLCLEQREDNSLYIQGPDEGVFKLIQVLEHVTPVDRSTKERKLMLLLQLIDATDPVKIGPLANDLGISAATLGTDLDDLEAWLQDFDVTLIRKRGVGVQLSGKESDKRKALENYYLVYFNEELIEVMFKITEPGQTNDRCILHFFKRDYLSTINKVLRQYIGTMYAELADSDYIGFLIMVCITVQRFESGRRLTNEDETENILTGNRETLPIIEQLSKSLSEELSIYLTKPEKIFLAVILKGSRLKNAESIYYDQVITGQKVKRLIQHVSKKLDVDLIQDFSLFQGLMAHLEPSLFRIREKNASPNPLTEQVKTQFPILFRSIGDSLKDVFPEIHFPDSEIAYIALHFGSALEQRREIKTVRALVVCPTGIGASKMLATLLQKKIPEITSVSVSSIRDMSQLDLNRFDLILTTVYLPKQKKPCILVNPLLSKENIREIHEVVRKLLRQVPKPFATEHKDGPPLNAPVHPLPELMNQMEQLIQLIRQLLNDFQVIPVRDPDSVGDLLQRSLEEAVKKGIVSNPVKVKEVLLKRERVAGLAIPGTYMALFHGRSPEVNRISFSIVHSGRPFVLSGMDGKQQQTNHFLILLAPEPMTPLQQEVISTVSSALIEDHESTLVFGSGNEKMIHAKLEDVFYKLIIQKFSKE